MMGFDLQWLLLALPLAFGLGWLASKLDARQWQREQKNSPKAYFKGLNFLLNDQQDQAIDEFIQAVQHDPDTSDLHFALGNLFRRRGEYERAVRVHEHLLKRADLPQAERERAQHALAQDFIKAGLFDRAEQAYQALQGSSFDTEARLALLTLHERSRNWSEALAIAQKLERSDTGSFSSRMAHYWCEISLQADASHDSDAAQEATARARAVAPQAGRPLLLAGQQAQQQGQHEQAVQLWNELLATQPGTFHLIANDYAHSALACQQHRPALERLGSLYQHAPSLNLLQALTILDTAQPAIDSSPMDRNRILSHLLQQPGVSAAQELLRQATLEQR
jgi:lipopolysaccharide assembly protein B